MAAPDSGNHSSSRVAVLSLSLALVGAAAMLYYHLGLFIPRVLEVSAEKGLGNGYSFGNDFYQVWLTSRQCKRGCDLYSSEMTRAIQTGMFGRPLDAHIPSDPTDRRVFPYPAFTDLLFWPAAELPFAVVRIIVPCLLAAMTFASVFLWMRALGWHPGWTWLAIIVLLTLFSYPVLEGLYAGQLGLLVGFLLAAAILALRRNRFLLAGILLALTTVKPQVTLLAILYVVLWSSHDWHRRGRFLAGLFPTVILLVGASLAVWPHWIGSWQHTLVAYHGYTPPALVYQVFASLLGPRASGPAAFLMVAGLMIFAVALAWRNRSASVDSLEFWLTLSVLLAITTISLLSGLAVYDHIILLPGIFLLASRKDLRPSSPIVRGLLAIGIAVTLWPWVAAAGLIVVRPLLRPEIFNSQAVLALPLRTAAAFPFVVLGLLGLALRNSLRDNLGNRMSNS